MRGVQTAFVDTTIDQRNININFTDQGTPQFKTKLQWKLNIILAALECNVTVLYMDSDIVLIRNPFSYLSSIPDVHFLAQKDGSVCSGFMFLYPKNTTMQMIDVARRIRNQINGGDQAAILAVIKEMETLKYKLLTSDLFMSGDVFFKKFNYYWDQISNYFKYVLINRI